MQQGREDREKQDDSIRISGRSGHIPKADANTDSGKIAFLEAE